MFCSVVARLLAQTTLRNILGTKNLHEILSERESISSSMQVGRNNLSVLGEHSAVGWWHDKKVGKTVHL